MGWMLANCSLAKMVKRNKKDSELLLSLVPVLAPHPALSGWRNCWGALGSGLGEPTAASRMLLV